MTSTEKDTTKQLGAEDNGGFAPTPSQKLAREIMGKNIFGIEEAIEYFDINPLKQQLTALAEVPFAERELCEARDTHVLVAVFRLSILDIRGNVERKFEKLFRSYGDYWYNNGSFAKGCGSVHWALVRKTPVSSFMSKTWGEQQALLSEEEETPSVRVMVYTIIGHYLATGERLFEKVYVRTSCVSSGDFHVCVGRFDSDGLDVSFWWNAVRDSDLGVAFSWKSRALNS